VALIAGIAVIGGAGAVARYAIYNAFAHTTGTLIVNVTGAFALGVLHAAGVTGDALTLMGTGFLGSYTTFSTWMLETTELPMRQAAANIAIPLAAGLGAVLLPTLV
jgi:fluoride exporter